MEKIQFEFEEVYTLNSKLVYQLAYAYLRNEDDAMDIHQEVFLAFFTKKPKIKTIDEIKYWLVRVTINKSINLLKYKKRYSQVDDYVFDSIKNIEEKNEDQVLYDFVCELDPIYKNIIILYYYDDMKTCDIAKLLKKKESTIRMRLHRARIILKDKMEEYINGTKN